MKAKKVVLLFVVCLMVLFSVACNTASGGTSVSKTEKTEDELKREQVETVIGEFEYACQTSDVNAMLECLNPGFSQSLQTGRLLLNWMSTDKKSDEAIMNTMVISLMHVSDITVDLTTMDIEIEEIELEEGYAVIDTVVTMDCSTGKYTQDLTMRMHLEKDGNWYIAGATI